MDAQQIFSYICYGWMAVAVITLIILRFVSAPYGRHTRPGWGPTLSNRLGWIIMESPGLIIMPTLFILGPAEKTPLHFILLSAYLGHYVHRAWIYPFRIRTQGKRMPIAIIGSAIFFNLVNTSLIGYSLGWMNDFPQDWLSHPIFWTGALLFVGGLAVNLDADTRLLHLRKPGETGYKIPQGGLFRFISCPNLFGEMVEWCGFAIMSWNLAGLTFAVWTIANLLPRALDHHQWYREKFADYPKARKAVIPGLW
jgi:3-oxo-5-alpha-steroid 4-dehydrogenase 1